jgi:hypothetical protein
MYFKRLPCQCNAISSFAVCIYKKGNVCSHVIQIKFLKQNSYIHSTAMPRDTDVKHPQFLYINPNIL